MNRPVNLFWGESAHYFGANSPVRNFERNVPEESSREELVLERTVPEQMISVDNFVVFFRLLCLQFHGHPSYFRKDFNILLTLKEGHT